MHLTIISVGHKMPAWVTAATNDYIKRMPADCSIAIKELKPALNSAKDAIQIEAAIPKGAHVIALDERGQDISTQDLANHLAQWRQDGINITFLIGGADGLDPSLKSRANALWKLSSLTLPHAFVRVLLSEQLYRAWTILQGHPYHRE
ncbi:23S rRNA (pseudouridine(1915)-N(3))-methyltransferase RlmH [Polynucleobacter sp. IMCC30063]|uniref:23S rRNA (pseudouridine(1915)-N(3))-methyltransferase RlmH n=1 Tax=unclassified Polynucleobacter TaxID=2640945 RepID=UPI001F158A34|nr:MULTISPECIES: 23S rRNA (pseudouridine(1915)-N(3))-methyltransferase RlmH [unclassified Polynucleobacter]MCE7506752.1 23S rRNA (pseudouridine(1915)-N(3))-methyltransferase RlmH [Polynucleobacter sp. IMCC30063]MCE7528176.1 23S rRNA (pseudouridine(1915)-N(3))-methyltransferase RlmH [Polynucleobacter sp. IMCC 30228]MCE7530008.1 23S rRNA (pseudouridine(1915)-N(3))-methyltransferase RlmH [Polynucleobacter sp. IMCC 29146]